MKSITIKKIYRNEEDINNIFIPTSKKWESTEDRELTIIESGPKNILFKKIIENINTASEMICLQSFLIQDTEIIDSLVEASERGVKIYILDAAETRLGVKGSYNDEDHITEGYKNMINSKFRYRFVHRQAQNLHAKFILFDPKTEYSEGFIFTGNFNTKPFTENPELGLPLTKEQTQELFQLFVYHFWEHTTDEQNETDAFDAVKPINKFAPPTLRSILCTSPNDKLSNLKEKLKSAIKTAKQEIAFSTFGLEFEHELSQEILNKINEGLKVTIFCRPREKTIVNHISKLAEAGATIFCDELIHAKSLIVDSKEAFLFTANFESHGMDTGFEVGAKLNEKQTKDLIYIHNYWKMRFPYRFFNKKNIQDVAKFYMLQDGKLEEKSIKESCERNKKKKHINNLKELKSYIETSNELCKNSKVSKISNIIDLNEYKDSKTKKLSPLALDNGIKLHEVYEKDIKSKETKLQKANKLVIEESIIEKKLEQLLEIYKYNESLTKMKLYVK